MSDRAEGRDATVDRDDGATRERARTAREERDGTDDVFGRADPLSRYVGRDLVAHLLGFEPIRHHLRGERTGRDRVHRDVAGSQVGAEVTGEHVHTGLGR